jgi:hypothetical protein
MKRILFCGALLLLALGFQGCFIVPIINGVKDMGVTEGDRARLFNKAVSDFHDYQRMQLLTEMASLVEPDWRQNFMNIFRQRRHNEKIVDFSIDLVEFSEGVTRANVEVAVRYFEFSRYVVETRIEQQTWVFSTSSGWRLNDLQVLPQAKT